MKFQKYIVLEKSNREFAFRCNYVEFHEDLISQDEKRFVIGGGFFDIDTENKIIKLWGRSCDFGSVPNKDDVFKSCFQSILVSIQKYYFFTSGEKLNMSEFKVVWVDELGEEHEITED